MNLVQSKRFGRQPLLWLARVLGATAILVACGGGGGSAGVAGAGTTATMARGPITGFGSVIVNGVRFDDKGADILINDEVAKNDDLRLGMEVEIEGERDPATAIGKATSISAASAVEGAISAIAGNTLTVLNMTVTITPRTVFEGVAGLAGLKVGAIVEIFGMANGQGGFIATRIEVKEPQVVQNEVRITGTVQKLDAAAKTFMINGTTVDFSAARLDDLPNGLTD